MHESFQSYLHDILVKVKLKCGKNCPVRQESKFILEMGGSHMPQGQELHAESMYNIASTINLYLTNTGKVPGQQRTLDTKLQGILIPATGARISVLLQTCGSQAAHAMAFDQALPGHEFFNRKAIAFACRLERKQAGSDRKYDNRLPTNHPPFGVRRWKICHRDRLAVRTYDHRRGR